MYSKLKFVYACEKCLRIGSFYLSFYNSLYTPFISFLSLNIFVSLSPSHSLYFSLCLLPLSLFSFFLILISFVLLISFYLFSFFYSLSRILFHSLSLNLSLSLSPSFITLFFSPSLTFSISFSFKIC